MLSAIYGVVFAVGALLGLVLGLRGGPVGEQRVARLGLWTWGLHAGFLGLLAVFLLVGDRVAWSILLPGLAWRAWLLVYVLPAWLAAWRRPSS